MAAGPVLYKQTSSGSVVNLLCHMDVPGHIDQARVDEKAGGSKDGLDQPVICCFLNLSPKCAGHPYLGCRKQNKCGIMLKTDLHMGQCKADNDIVDRSGQKIDPAGYFPLRPGLPPAFLC